MMFQGLRFQPALVATCAAAAFSLVAASSAANATATPNTAAQSAMGVKFGGFFSDQQKTAVRRAFAQKYAKAKQCPEGLEKKGKSCASPWNTRYWAVGQELQPAVQVYPVAEISAALPPVPKGYEYVRAADDILLISSGTKLVVDMIEHVAG